MIIIAAVKDQFRCDAPQMAGIKQPDEDMDNTNVEECFWLEDDTVIATIRRIETIQPSKLQVSVVINFYKKYPQHPIVLACLAESISKVFGGIEADDAIAF